MMPAQLSCTASVNHDAAVLYSMVCVANPAHDEQLAHVSMLCTASMQHSGLHISNLASHCNGAAREPGSKLNHHFTPA